ncbi:septin interacting protein 1 [Oratosquilla oratoria]|uniref:septin interacting protein 1 n=1 Tax=Oratosquilla oratoria TaxID=337810 RepID=UPI003F75F60A
MSDNEVEKFEITDYDLEHEFNHRGRRLTKEQQIYGIWAQGSDGEEEVEEKGPPQPRILRGGMSFICAGVQQAGKKPKEDSNQQEGEEEEEEPELMPRVGLGGGDSSDEEEPVRTNLPTSYGGQKTPSSSSSSGFSAARRGDMGMRRGGMGIMGRGAGGGGALGSHIGEWEKYTTGIGSKLLKKMGYEEGKGLGKNLQGISTPVEASKRKGKGAIGFYGSERNERSLKDFPVNDLDEEEKQKFKEQLQQWKKSGDLKKKNIRYIYKSAEEVIQEGKVKKVKPTNDSHITKTKVIDMTGPETRVLSSYHAIGGQKSIGDEYEEIKKKKYEHFDLPELLHNLQVLLEKCEDDIVQNARVHDRENDRIVHLNHERERYDELLEREEKELKSLNQALKLVEELQTRHSDSNNPLTLSEAFDIFKQSKHEYPKIYSSYEIAYLAPTYITPLLKELLKTWNPLSDPKAHIGVFASWQKLVNLEGDMRRLEDQPMDPYHHLVWESWAAVVRSTVMGVWEPRNSGPLITLLEEWGPPIVPSWIIGHLLQHIILPKINKEVEQWAPVEDTIPIHTWIHPWLPILQDRLQIVYPVIRQKLASALVQWHPSDRSAKMVLQPWKGVFLDTSLAALIQMSIQPKLEICLNEMLITPHNQNLDPWHWFLDWDGLLPPQISLDILERCFFPRLYQAMGAWLSNNPNHHEVIAWYKGWRDLIPRSVANHQQVKQKFQQALEVCCRALSYQPGATDQFNLLMAGLGNISDPPPPPPPGSPPPPPPTQAKDWADIISTARRETMSMRELVERRCLERGVIFLPIPDRNHEGRPVYKCGRFNISFNKNVIYVQTERGWTPQSITTLIDEA